jgi:hypothetical protein
MTFDEVCRRASGRRAYNRRRRLIRAHRISIILGLQDHFSEIPGRYLASVLGVHESTISRDLAFIAKIKANYRKSAFGCEMHANSFRWIQDARGYETQFHILNGVRLK